MDRDNPYFLVSGFISISFFIFFVSLFLYMMLSNSKVTDFALNKDNYISISLETVQIPTKQVKKTKTIPNVEQKSIEEVKEIDIGDLFSDVWTKDIKIKKEEKKVDNKRLELINKKIKTSKENVVEPITEVIKNNEADITDTQNKKSSTANEVNEYLAKIQAIVYKYFEPPANSQGHTVKVIIELSAIGKVLDFRILTYSTNKALNKECDKIKYRLASVLFPQNPQGESFRTVVNITSDK